MGLGIYVKPKTAYGRRVKQQSQHIKWVKAQGISHSLVEINRSHWSWFCTLRAKNVLVNLSVTQAYTCPVLALCCVLQLNVALPQRWLVLLLLTPKWKRDHIGAQTTACFSWSFLEVPTSPRPFWRALWTLNQLLQPVPHASVQLLRVSYWHAHTSKVNICFPVFGDD